MLSLTREHVVFVSYSKSRRFLYMSDESLGSVGIPIILSFTTFYSFNSKRPYCLTLIENKLKGSTRINPSSEPNMMIRNVCWYQCYWLDNKMVIILHGHYYLLVLLLLLNPSFISPVRLENTPAAPAPIF
jgi:hypothetical protein